MPLIGSGLLVSSDLFSGGGGGGGGGGGYTGPGDLGITFSFWGGLRAFSAAKAAATAAAIKVCSDSTDATVNPQDINVTTAGDLDTSALSTYISGHTHAYVSKIYDQSGNGLDLSAPFTFPEITTSTLHIDGTGRLFNDSVAVSQPYTICCVWMSTTSTSDSSSGAGGKATDVRLTIRSTNLLGIYAAGADLITATGMTASSYHATQGYYNGNSSLVNVDGGTSGTGGGGAPGSSALTGFYSPGGADQLLSGGWKESGIIASASGIYSTLTTNMKTYWGL